MTNLYFHGTFLDTVVVSQSSFTLIKAKSKHNQAKSKKQAEQLAARAFFEQLKNYPR